MRITTIRKYPFFDVASALQKGIRRGDARLAGYWAVELYESGYCAYLWRRLLIISAEDCAYGVTHEIWSLFEAWRDGQRARQERPPGVPAGRIFVAKAVLFLCAAEKCRDADHLTNLVYDTRSIRDEDLWADLAASRDETIPIPDYAYDVHTATGRRRGRTKADFFRVEWQALKPRRDGLFDSLVFPSGGSRASV